MMKEKEEEVDLNSQPSKAEAEAEPEENPNQGFMYYLVRSFTSSKTFTYFMSLLMTFSGTTVSKRECHGLFTFLLKYKFTTFRTCYYQTGALSQKWFSYIKLFFAVMTPFALRMYV